MLKKYLLLCAFRWCGHASFSQTQYFPGSVGIGVSNPVAKLEISGTSVVAKFGVSAGITDHVIIGIANDRAFIGYDGARSQTVIQANAGKGIDFNVNNNVFGAGTAMSINYNGNVGIGTTSPTVALDIVAPGSKQLRLSTSTADASNKIGYITTRNFNNTEEDFLGMLLQGTATANILTFGGGGSSLNAATELRFNTAATPTTLLGTTKVVITAGGKVGIGTTTPAEELSVNGNIRSKQVKVEISNWPDYVFKPNYQLMPLEEVDGFIKRNGHLPDVPTEREVTEAGLNLGDMNRLLLKKVEELTLYLIEKDEQLRKMEETIKQIQEKNTK